VLISSGGQSALGQLSATIYPKTNRYRLVFFRPFPPSAGAVSGFMGMKQQALGLNLSTLRTRKAVFLDEMNLMMPRTELLALIIARPCSAGHG
jgi:hypothetical protein